MAQVLVDGVGWRDGYALIGGTVLALALPVGLLPWRRITQGAVAHKGIAGPEVRTVGLARAIRSRPFWALFAVFFATSLAVYGVSLQTVAFLVEQGFPPLQAAGAFGFAGMLSVVGMLITGTAADRFGNRVTATLSYLSTLVGILALFLVQAHPGFVLVVVFVIFFGSSMGARGPIVSTLSTTLFAGRGIGAIYGTITTGQGLGAATGVWLAGALHDATGGYEAGFLASSGAILTSMALFWVVPELSARRRRSAQS